MLSYDHRLSSYAYCPCDHLPTIPPNFPTCIDAPPIVLRLLSYSLSPIVLRTLSYDLPLIALRAWSDVHRSILPIILLSSSANPVSSYANPISSLRDVQYRRRLCCFQAGDMIGSRNFFRQVQHSLPAVRNQMEETAMCTQICFVSVVSCLGFRAGRELVSSESN
eukprot:2519300-Rhodomonas_salina.1